MEKDTSTNTMDTESVYIEHPPEANDQEYNEPEPVGKNGDQSNPGSVKSIPSSKKRRLRTGVDDRRLAQAFRIMDNAEKSTRDDCSTFGEFIASKLRKFSDRNRNFLMHKIDTLIFESEMNIDENHEQALSSESSIASESLMQNTKNSQVPSAMQMEHCVPNQDIDTP